MHGAVFLCAYAIVGIVTSACSFICGSGLVMSMFAGAIWPGYYVGIVLWQIHVGSTLAMATAIVYIICATTLAVVSPPTSPYWSEFLLHLVSFALLGIIAIPVAVVAHLIGG